MGEQWRSKMSRLKVKRLRSTCYKEIVSDFTQDQIVSREIFEYVIGCQLPYVRGWPR